MRALSECYLRVAFAQASPGAGARSDAQLLGDAAHEVLAELIEPGAPFEDRMQRVGDALLDRLGEQADGRVRRSQATAARLRGMAARATALIGEAGDGVQIDCERRLTSHEGRLEGIIDLALMSPTLHAVVDYKTGRVLDEHGELAGSMQQQLALYCVLRHELTGCWPDRAVILRFGGSPVEWAVDQDICQATVEEALRLRASYSEQQGTTPPASPSTTACRFCPFAPRCEAFWEAIPSEQEEEILGVRGTVAWARGSSAGGITLQLSDAEGSRVGEVVVQQLSGDILEVDVAPGVRIALVGLWVDRDGQLTGGRGARAWITD